MTHHKLVIAEKPSVAQSIAAVLGATKRNDGYLSGNGYLVSWCFGHLAELAARMCTMKSTQNGAMTICPSCPQTGASR